MLTLIEQAEQHFDQAQAEKAAEKLSSGQLTLEDFLEQMLAVRKMGPIANLLGMLPGAGQMKDQLAQVDDKHLDRLQAIIRGMTPAERTDPKIINASRRQRIARGSGVAVRDVNELVNRFFEARKMMQQMAGRFGLPGANRKNRKGKKGRKGKGRGATPRRRSFSPSEAESPAMTALHMRGVVLPDGEERDLWIVNGRIRTEAVAGAETIVDGGFLLPGLVDAHCHVGIDAEDVDEAAG